MLIWRINWRWKHQDESFGYKRRFFLFAFIFTYLSFYLFLLSFIQSVCILSHPTFHKKAFEYLGGHGDGLVVIVDAFNSDDPSSAPAGANLIKLFWSRVATLLWYLTNQIFQKKSCDYLSCSDGLNFRIEWLLYCEIFYEIGFWFWAFYLFYFPIRRTTQWALVMKQYRKS